MRQLRAFLVVFAGIGLAVTSWCWCGAQTGRPAGKPDKAVVWMAFFSSTDCPKCESAKLLIEALKSKYRVRVKTFDVERDKDYSLFKAVQAIHSSGGLSVPLILVGDVILAGEEEIDAKLEETVRGLAKAGGAELPYLGPDHTAPAPTKRDKCDFDKNRPGRPPSAPEEWGKFRSFLDYFF